VGLMRTRLSEQQLVRIRADAPAHVRESDFVNPWVAAESRRVLRERGEQWVESVLGRQLSRRSVFFPDLPWLAYKELHIIISADAAETRQDFSDVVDGL